MSDQKQLQAAIKDFERFKVMGYGHSDLPSSGNIEIAIESMRDKADALESIQRERQEPEPLTEERCPICGYLIELKVAGMGCQCLFSGSCHLDRHKKAEVVKDHLYLFTPTQVKHVLSLEKYWQIGYGDAEMNVILKELLSAYAAEPKGGLDGK